jgi:predicted nucleic acid-binding protein
MIYCDANVLIPTVVNVVEERRTGLVERLLRTHSGFYISALAEYEARKQLCALPDVELRQASLSAVLEAKFTLLNDWQPAILHALKLAHRFKARLAVDSADTLHVGWALSVGADVFASFDRTSGPRALALCVGLKVWPDPSARDFESMARLKRSRRRSA